MTVYLILILEEMDKHCVYDKGMIIMEALLVGNMIMLLFWVYITFIFNDSEKYKVVIFIYISAFLVNFFDVVPTIQSYAILLVALFIDFEFLEDEFKKQIVTNIVDKMLDFAYQMWAQYSIIFFTFSLFISSEWFGERIGYRHRGIIYLAGFGFLYLSCKNAASKKFVLCSFDDIKRKIDKVIKYRSFLELEEPICNPACILCIEDKNYYFRGEKYTFCNRFYLKRRYWKKLKDYLLRLLCCTEKKETIIYALRGYSTIEMQLLRTVSIEEGYDYVIRRKVFEIVYAKVFLKNLKKYFEKCNCITTGFKDYILYLYLQIAPCLNKGGEERLEEVLGTERKEISKYTKEQLFILTLCFSGKIKREEVTMIYEKEIEELQLDINEIHTMLEKMNE